LTTAGTTASGTVGSSTGGNGSTGGTAATTDTASTSGQSGCSCRIAGVDRSTTPWAAMFAFAVVVGGKLRRRILRHRESAGACSARALARK
jgi:MYXO-CTERM domain-containing protein